MRILIATLIYKYDVDFEAGFDSYAFESAIRDNGSLLEIITPLKVVFTKRKNGAGK